MSASEALPHTAGLLLSPSHDALIALAWPGLRACPRHLIALSHPFNAIIPRACVCVCVCSSLLEQKEDLRKRLSYTTHKLELLQNEFDSTRQYLETELRRAQEELDKFTDKLRRWAQW